MEIRACVAADRKGVVSLWEACGLTRPWNDPGADFDQAIRTATSTVLGAFEDSQVIASVMVGFDGHRGWLYYLAVTGNQQRQGIGRTMMSAAEAWLGQHGAVKIQLMVREDNATALAFYERLGIEKQAVVTLGRRLDAR